jgi:hypothetical protein
MNAQINKEGKLVVTLDFDKAGKMSVSGKSLVHATTNGNKPLSLDGKVIYIGVNAYSKK